MAHEYKLRIGPGGPTSGAIRDLKRGPSFYADTGDYTCFFCCDVCNLFSAASDAGRNAEISAGAMAAAVPSAGMPLYQTDFAFLPV
jgi:hypothetical protein